MLSLNDINIHYAVFKYLNIQKWKLKNVWMLNFTFVHVLLHLNMRVKTQNRFTYMNVTWEHANLCDRRSHVEWFLIHLLCTHTIVPPAGDAQQGYPPQQPGYPPQEGYQPYPPPAKGYVPPPVPQGYAPVSTGQQNIVIDSAPASQQTTIIREERPRVNHILHLLITILFFPWLFVWIILCAIYGAWVATAILLTWKLGN